VGRSGPSREARSRRSSGRGRTPRGGVGRRRGAGAEVREDLVDHGPLRDARDDPHGPATGRAGQRVDLKDLLQERRRRAFAHRRLAYQWSYRVVTCSLSGMWTSTRARNSSGSTVSVPAVGPSDLSERYVTAFALRS